MTLDQTQPDTLERKAATLLAYLRDRTDSEFAGDIAGEFGEDVKARLEGVIANQADRITELETQLQQARRQGREEGIRHSVAFIRQRAEESAPPKYDLPLVTASAYLHGCANDLEEAALPEAPSIKDDEQ